MGRLTTTDAVGKNGPPLSLTSSEEDCGDTSSDCSLDCSWNRHQQRAGWLVVRVVSHVSAERSHFMTFLSLADGCRHLGIDPKTLRRWLEDSHRPGQRHSLDGG